METSKSASGHVIKARKLKDGFTFKLSMDHIIEQTLLKHYNSPHFRKSTIQIDDKLCAESDPESSDSDDSTNSNISTKRTKGVPIKLQLKRQYAEEPTVSDLDPVVGGANISRNSNSSEDQPLDMSSKRIKKEKSKPIDVMTSIPPGWIMKGLTREDHIKFQGALARASLTPHQRAKYQQDKSDSS